MTPDPASSRGVALVITLLVLGMVSAIGLGLVLAGSLDRMAVRNHDEAIDLLNASDAALELAARDLAAVGDWDDVLGGVWRSPLADGEPGLRVIGSDASVDINVLTNRLICGRTDSCTDAQRRASTRDRPWGANNPWWRPFLHFALVPPAPLPTPVTPAYVIVWVGDDGSEADGNPAADGAGPGQEGRYKVRVRIETFGPRGGRHAVEAELARVCEPPPDDESCRPGVRVQSWRVVSAVIP